MSLRRYDPARWLNMDETDSWVDLWLGRFAMGMALFAVGGLVLAILAGIMTSGH